MVCNQGMVGGAAEMMLVLSEDDAIRFSYSGPPEQQDLPLSSLYVGQLEAGQCTPQPVQASANPSNEEGWYLGAVVDPCGWEPGLIENHNTWASAIVGMGMAPDLVIRTVTGPASVQMGELLLQRAFQ
jgi:hypothetical protein